MAYCTNCGTQVDGEFCTKCGKAVGASPPPTQQSSSAAYPSYPQSATPSGAPPARKRGPLFWILVGCGGLILIGGILVVASGLFFVRMAKQAGVDPDLMQKNPSLAVAKMLAATNPDIEVVSLDENLGVIRVREKKTGKIMIMNLADAKNGKITFEDEAGGKVEIQAQGEGDKASIEVKGPEGTMKIGAGAALPDWLPAYPGAEATGSFGMRAEEGNAGSYSFQTGDAVEKVAVFYEQTLRKAGFEVQRAMTQTQGSESMIILSADHADSQRTATITAAGKDKATTVSLIFGTKK